MKKFYLLVVSLLLLVVTACGAATGDAYLPSYNESASSNQPELEESTDEYLELQESDYINTQDNNKVNVSLDSSTAAYANIRKLINNMYNVPKDAVNIEQMLNYFNYSYVNDTENQLTSFLEMAKCPWNEDNYLLSVAVKAKDYVIEEDKPNNFVFLLDVSGSMYSEDKLPLLVESFNILIDNLKENDRVSIVTYAGSEKVLLDGGYGHEKAKISAIISDLTAGGSTAGSKGIQKAYELAEKYFIEGGNNRVFLATDGDFNVGISSINRLESFISEKRETGVYLSLFGFGRGNLQSDTMDTLAQAGNGNYYYIDSLLEAQKVFVTELGGTLQTVAKDAKVQIQFNEDYVEKYRLIGYENKILTDEEFENNETDAGEIGAGHTTVCMIEVVLKEEVVSDLSVIANCIVRYKDVTDANLDKEVITSLYEITQTPSDDFLFQSAVVEFGLILRDSMYKYDASLESIVERVSKTVYQQDSYKKEFGQLVIKYMNDYHKN